MVLIALQAVSVISPAFDSTLIARSQFQGQDIGWLLRQWVNERPEHPFLIWEPRNGEQVVLTYSEFYSEATCVAAGLVDRGVGLGDKVLIHADNCVEMVVSWYACALVGAVGVTTNTRSVAAEIEYFATHTECVGAITQPQYAELVIGAAPNLRFYFVTESNSGERADETIPSGFEPYAALRGNGSALPALEPDPLLPAGIVFTSGTTSRPKAVVHTHGNALWAAKVGPRNIAMDGESVYLVYLPFFHVNAQSWSTWTTLGVGGTVVLQPKFSASRFWEVIQKHSVTHVSLIPFVFKAVAAEPIPDHTVKVGVFGLIMPELDAWLKMRVFAAYGMTETVIHAVHADMAVPHSNGTMGRPTAGYEAMVVDPETGVACTQGEVGELWMRGTRGIQMFLEYYKNPEANAAAFTDDGWFKTGDRVRVAEGGELFYTDRDKDLLKVGGENVSAREVEDAIRQVPGIGDVAVVSAPHEMLDMVPVAFVIRGWGGPDSDEEFSEQIVAHCGANLANFKVPRAVYFVEDFPRATLDKVAKNLLRDMAAERYRAEP